MSLKIQMYTQFKKDVKLAKKRHYDMSLLKDVIDTPADGRELNERYRDHQLTGDYAGYRECHILPDWLLVYKIVGETLTLVLAKTGTHSDLF